MSGERVIGIDLGGTKALGAVLDGKHMIQQRKLGVKGMDTEKLMDRLYGLVRELIGECSDVEAIGLGIPSQIDQARGVAVASVNQPIENLPIREEFEQHFNLPVAVENDANCAAYAEASMGAGRGCEVIVCLTVGTGIGCGVVIDGKIMRGSRGFASEAGHMIIDINREYSDGFPKLGSLENYASGSALEAMAGGRGGEDVLQAARGGDREMAEIFERLAKNLGVGVANMINIFNPDAVVIGGGVSNAGRLLVEPAKKEAEKWALDAPMREANIVSAELGHEAGVIGAALVARDAAS